MLDHGECDIHVLDRTAQRLSQFLFPMDFEQAQVVGNNLPCNASARTLWQLQQTFLQVTCSHAGRIERLYYRQCILHSL